MYLYRRYRAILFTFFITTEAYSALKEWMDFRVSYGEKITVAFWLMRNMADN